MSKFMKWWKDIFESKCSNCAELELKILNYIHATTKNKPPSIPLKTHFEILKEQEKRFLTMMEKIRS